MYLVKNLIGEKKNSQDKAHRNKLTPSLGYFYIEDLNRTLGSLDEL